MNEADKKKIINIIQKEINEKNSLGSKYEKLKELVKNPSVKEYLSLLEDINKIENNIEIQSMDVLKTL